jgi:hypothetical protein
MSEIIDRYQRSLMEHTLGGIDSKQWFRNHFCANPGHIDLPDLIKLVEVGFMKEVPAPTFCHDETKVFVVTEIGKKFLSDNQ